MGFSTSLMPVKSLQVTRLRLVTWKDFTGIRDVEKPILALPHHWIVSFYFQEFLITGSGNRLSSKTVVRLTSSCQELRWIGDLSYWNINTKERNLILPKLLYTEGQSKI